MKDVFNAVGIIAKPDDPLIKETIQSLYQFLVSCDTTIYVDAVAQKHLECTSEHVLAHKDMAKEVQLAIVVGGDGTMLNAAHTMILHDIPLLGINRGRLGFLADITPEEMHGRLEQIFAGEYLIQDRSALYATLTREETNLESCIAVNDVVVHAREVVRMIELETVVEGKFLNSIRADGLIVSTPTGSTAYALSGGGPIIHPNVQANVIVPICPHTLSNRPIVVNQSSEIEITFSKQNYFGALASIDGQINRELAPGDRILIQPSERPLRIVQPQDQSYFSVLRKKLGWSSQP